MGMIAAVSITRPITVAMRLFVAYKLYCLTAPGESLPTTLGDVIGRAVLALVIAWVLVAVARTVLIGAISGPLHWLLAVRDGR